MNINPYPQSFQWHEKLKIYLQNAIFETIETPKKPPGQKIFQEDQMKPLNKSDVIKYLDDINKEKMKSLDAWFRNRSKKSIFCFTSWSKMRTAFQRLLSPYLLAITCVWNYFINAYQLLCPSGLQREEIRSSIVSAWFKISYCTWKIDQKNTRRYWLN